MNGFNVLILLTSSTWSTVGMKSLLNLVSLSSTAVSHLTTMKMTDPRLTLTSSVRVMGNSTQHQATRLAWIMCNVLMNLLQGQSWDIGIGLMEQTSMPQLHTPVVPILTSRMRLSPLLSTVTGIKRGVTSLCHSVFVCASRLY